MPVAVRSQLKVAARTEPAAMRGAHWASSPTTPARAWARASSSPTGTSTAASPATSGMPPTAVATTGVPRAMASSMGKPKPSSRDGNARARPPGQQ